MLKLELAQAARCCASFLAKTKPPKTKRMKKRKFYAVAQGQQPGIYDTWEACKRQVDGYRGSRYKSFVLREEAERYLVESSVPTSVSSNPKSQRPAEGLGQAMQNVVKNSQRTKANGRTSKAVIRKQAKDSDKQLLSPTSAQPQLEGPQRSLLSTEEVYQLEYDGASKGNPGLAGAGALLRHPDGSVVCELTEGLGIATNNAAEYCALILGLREALRRGIKRIKVQGDSLLVCQQVLGKWAIKSENLRSLWEEAKRLTESFTEFTIQHVDREYNSAADALANRAVELRNKS